MSFYRTGKKVLFLGLVVIFLLVFIRQVSPGYDFQVPMTKAIYDALAPVQKSFSQLGYKIREAVTYPVYVVRAVRNERKWEEREALLKSDLVEAEEYRQENMRLRKLLDFDSKIAPRAGMEVTVAPVIGRDSGNWFGTIRVGKGSWHGIKRDMMVLTPQGLVGRVISTSGGTAEVLLVTDPRSGVGSLIQESRAPGIVEGMTESTGLLRMIHIPNDITVVLGQKVVTSGIGSIYTKGIPVGKVVGIGRERSGLFRTAVLKPAVDFDLLEEVMVVTKTSKEITGSPWMSVPPGKNAQSAVYQPSQ